MHPNYVFFMKLTKKRYLQGFLAVTLVSWLSCVDLSQCGWTASLWNAQLKR